MQIWSDLERNGAIVFLKKFRDRELVGQVTKYSFTGVFLTFFYSVLYSVLVYTNDKPMVAHFIAYAISIVVGFLVNRYWSFRGYGRQKTMWVSGLRFSAVSLVGLSLNTFFVWLLTGPIFNGPNWWPLIPVVLVTPFATFSVNRKWVFS